MREAGEASMTRVSLIISVLAVMVALVTVLGHREHTEAVLSQARASDRWSEYQGRRIRQAQLVLAGDLLSLQSNVNPAALEQKLAQYRTSATHTQTELQDDMKEAKVLEAEVVKAEHKAVRYDFGEALLQISVVLASITLITRRWWYVLVAVGLGSIGLLAAASALLVH